MNPIQLDLALPQTAANDNIYNVRLYRLKHESKYRTPEWLRTRRIALDRAGHKCERCLRTRHQCARTGDPLDAHHIEPVALYPELFHVLSNITVLCRRCHDVETMKQSRRYGWRYAFR
jgi:5-methylcytosine-specific restriction endonuclease McrA